MASSDFQKLRRHLTTARREMRRAVDRFAEVDALEGHRAEALRLIREVRAEADAAVKAFTNEDPR